MKADLISLSKAEVSAIGEALAHPERSLSEVIPRDIGATECLSILEAGVAIYRRGDEKMGHLAAILGRGLAVLRVRPDILEAAGYKNLGDYEQDEIIAKGLSSHGPIWKHKKICETWADLSVVDVIEIGSTKLEKGARALPRDASDGQRKEVLRGVREAKSVQEVEKFLVNRGLSETEKDSFTIVGPASEIAELKAVLADERYVKFTEGAATALDLIMAAIDWTRREWDHSEDQLDPAMVAADPEVAVGGAEEDGAW